MWAGTFDSQNMPMLVVLNINRCAAEWHIHTGCRETFHLQHHARIKPSSQKKSADVIRFALCWYHTHTHTHTNSRSAISFWKIYLRGNRITSDGALALLHSLKCSTCESALQENTSAAAQNRHTFTIALWKVSWSETAQVHPHSPQNSSIFTRIILFYE